MDLLATFSTVTMQIRGKQQLDEYFARQQLLNSSLSFDCELLEKNFHRNQNGGLINSMGKIWKDKSNFNETDLTYLMPEFAKWTKLLVFRILSLLVSTTR